MTEALLSLLLHATRPGDVTKLVDQYESLRVSRMACKFQLNDKIVPSECYSTLRQEQKLGLLNAKKGRILEKQLDLLCKKFSLAAVTSEQSELPRPTRMISAYCRSEIEKMQAIARYKNAAETWSGN
jgi:hypothetical protein